MNFAVNQAWGRFGLSVIGNPIHATYYGAAPGAPGYVPSASCVLQPGTTFCSYPDDEWGWAVLSGIDIKAPVGSVPAITSAATSTTPSARLPTVPAAT